MMPLVFLNVGYSLVSSLKISCQSVKGQETSLSQLLLSSEFENFSDIGVANRRGSKIHYFLWFLTLCGWQTRCQKNFQTIWKFFFFFYTVNFIDQCFHTRRP